MPRQDNTDPRIIEARDASFVGQKELGSILELSPQRIDVLLDALGLRAGRVGTPYAESLGAASERLTGRSEKDGQYAYCLWRPEIVVPLLRAVA